jgi:hypothetical protein
MLSIKLFLQLLVSSTFLTTLVSASDSSLEQYFERCSGSEAAQPGKGYLEWKKDGWNKLYELRTNLCSVYQQGAHSNVASIDKSNKVGDAFYVIQPGMSSKFCWDATQIIIERCFDTDGRSAGHVYQTGSWNNGHEGYQINVNVNDATLFCHNVGAWSSCA